LLGGENAARTVDNAMVGGGGGERKKMTISEPRDVCLSKKEALLCTKTRRLAPTLTEKRQLSTDNDKSAEEKCHPLQRKGDLSSIR